MFPIVAQDMRESQERARSWTPYRHANGCEIYARVLIFFYYAEEKFYLQRILEGVISSVEKPKTLQTQEICPFAYAPFGLKALVLHFKKINLCRASGNIILNLKVKGEKTIL